MATAALLVIGVPVSLWAGREYQRTRQAFEDYQFARARFRRARAIRRQHLSRVAIAAAATLLVLIALISG